tara:strand:+ start:636 stop:1589 length:954 start_codon:yes stop_codon:yes gene_type:complete
MGDMYGIRSSIGLSNQEMGMSNQEQMIKKLHNKEITQELQGQLSAEDTNEKIDGGVSALTTGVGIAHVKESFDHYGQFSKKYDVAGQGYVKANVNFLKGSPKNISASIVEPQETSTLSTSMGEQDLVKAVPDKPPPPPMISGSAGKMNEVSPAEPVKLESDPSSAIGSEDKEIASSLGEKEAGSVAGAIGHGVSKALGVAGGVENVYKDIKSGHLAGDNWESKVGDVGSEIGSALDVAGTFVPVLEPIGAVITGVSAVLSGIGSLVDDGKKKAQMTADAQKQMVNVGATKLSLSGQGLIASASTGDNYKQIAGSGVF